MQEQNTITINFLPVSGKGDEKGKVMGIFRSLGALSRALGPFLACTGIYTLCVLS